MNTGTYIVRADDTSVVLDYLATYEGLAIEGNPDVYVRTYTQFAMDDARALLVRAQTRALTDAGRIFVIMSPKFMLEAQNAMLKTLEEPPAGTRFFLVTPTPETLLPTVRSRAQTLVLAGEGSERREAAKNAAAFLAALPAARLDLLKPLLEKNDDDQRELGPIIAFLSELERLLAEHPRAQTADGLAAIYRSRRYLADKGALMKPLLEQVALLVPKL